MKSETLLLVGDKFSNFAQGKDAITISKLKTLLKKDDFFTPYQTRIKLILGQGIGDDILEDLLSEAPSTRNYKHFDLSMLYGLPRRAERKLSHKSKIENTLLSAPTRLNESLYQMHLLIDDRSELMHDHQTGQHIQGMILVEAARQSLLIVAEAFYIPDNHRESSVVLNNINVNYNNFAFPFEAILNFNIINKTIKKITNMRFEVEIDIVQSGISVASFEIDYSVVGSKLISNREGALAEKALLNHLEANQISIGEAANG